MWVWLYWWVCKRCNLRPQRRNRRRSFVCSGARALAGKLVGVAGHVRLRTVPDAQPNAGCHPVKTRRIRFFLRYAGASLTPSCSIQRDSRRSISSRRPCSLFAQLFGRCQTATLRLPKTLIPFTWQSGIWPSTTPEHLSREPTCGRSSRTKKLRPVLAHQSFGSKAASRHHHRPLIVPTPQPPAHVGKPLGTFR